MIFPSRFWSTSTWQTRASTQGVEADWTLYQSSREAAPTLNPEENFIISSAVRILCITAFVCLFNRGGASRRQSAMSTIMIREILLKPGRTPNCSIALLANRSPWSQSSTWRFHLSSFSLLFLQLLYHLPSQTACSSAASSGLQCWYCRCCRCSHCCCCSCCCCCCWHCWRCSWKHWLPPGWSQQIQ